MADVEYPVAFIAQLFGISDRRIQELAKEKVLIKTGRGKYPLIQNTQAYTEYLRGVANGQHLKSVSHEDEKKRLTTAKADREEFELKVKQQEFAPIDMIYTCTADVMILIKSKMRNLDKRLLNQLLGEADPIEFKRKLIGEVNLALAEVPADIQELFKEYLADES